MRGAVEVRRACAADLDQLVELALGLRDHLAQTAPSRAQFRAGFARLLGESSARFFIARAADASPVGYVQCRYRFSAWSGGTDVELEDVYVAAAARGGGVGRRLVEAVLDDAAADGCRVAGLTTNERNDAALALYVELGFAAARPRWQGGRQLWLERRVTPGA
ncbi:MAG: GNAT family N-acetyltransferase [Deltaproteobacteria bacterium]|nr:GNAT family N-acetyltransferase [Deltaproteobacteria bacterium]